MKNIAPLGIAAILAAMSTTPPTSEVNDDTKILGEDATYGEVTAFADNAADRIHIALHDSISSVGFGPKTADRAEGMILANLVQKYLKENPESTQGFAEFLEGVFSVARLDSMIDALSVQD